MTISLRTDVLEQVKTFLEKEIEELRLPAAALAVGVGEQTYYQTFLGYAENYGQCVRPVLEDTLFDLASLTKVVATLPAVLLLIEQGKVCLDDPIADFLPAFSTGGKSSITIRHLLTHTGGFAQTPRYYQTARTPVEMLEKIYETPLQYPVGTQVIYSDIGYMVLSKVVEAVTERAFDVFVKANIFEPLQLHDTLFSPSSLLENRIAATEVFPGAQEARVGVVHDRNAEALGGVSGHAGLFSSLSDVVRYVKAWVQPTESLLSMASRLQSVRCHTQELADKRGLGWVCGGGRSDHMGDLWPMTAVGHTGFTGTSIAFDLTSQLWTVLLTNEIHYGRDNRTISQIRARVHNLVGASLIK